MDTKVEKSRKGWQVSTHDREKDVWVKVCWFVSQTEAYAFAYKLEHGL